MYNILHISVWLYKKECDYGLKRRIRTYICLLLIIAVFIAAILPGCAAGVQKMRLSAEDAYHPQTAQEEYRRTDGDNLSLVASSPFLGLYFDEQNASIAIKDNKSGKYTYSVSSEADKFGLSSVMSLKISDEDGRVYHLNSCDNSVVFKAFKTEKIENGISVCYSLALNAKDALCQKELIEKDVFRADITLIFELDGDALTVSVDCAGIFISDGYVLENLRILPGFASGAAQKGDYFVIPDGCGALADISGKAPADVSYKYYCYGADAATGEDGAKAYLPFFAFKYGDMAVCTTVEEGDANAVFQYSRKAGQSGGAVFPEFTVTLTERTEKHLYSGRSYDGIIKVRYTFIGNRKITYIDVATVCRERLIRTSVLPTSTLTVQSSIPFLLVAVGANSSSSKDSYTEYYEAKEMLSIFKAKGVNNIAMRYMGTLSGGLDQKAIEQAKLQKTLGNQSELNALTDYARVQNLEVFFDIDIMNTDKDGALRTLRGDRVKLRRDSSIKFLFEAAQENAYAASLKNLKSNVSSALSLLEDRNVSLGDVSETLYSDSSYGFTKQESMDYINESLRAFDVKRNVMLSQAALYLLKSAKYVSSLPMRAETAFDDNITAIPLLQTVLHGTLYYAGEPLNFSGDLDYSVLKCVEYGCMPSAVLTYRSVRLDYDTYYVTQSPKLAKVYERMNAELSDLYGHRITGHTKVYEDVYCTEYANTTLVYVNYTNESVEINGLTLEAMDYMRVN